MAAFMIRVPSQFRGVHPRAMDEKPSRLFALTVDSPPVLRGYEVAATQVAFCACGSQLVS